MPPSTGTSRTSPGGARPRRPPRPGTGRRGSRGRDAGVWVLAYATYSVFALGHRRRLTLLFLSG